MHAVPLRPAVDGERGIAAFVIATTLVMALTAASASALGGVNAGGLVGMSMAASTGAPTVIAWDAFTGSNGTSLNGATTDDGLHTWSQFGGSWTIQGNKARSSKASPSGLILDAGVYSGASEVVITASGTYDAEVIVNSNSTGSDHLLLDWVSGGGGSLELWKYVGGSYTMLTSVTGLGAPSNRTIRLESTSGNVMKGYVDGVLRLTHTLSAGEQTTFKNASHTYFGIVAYNDNGSTFDNFHVDA